MLAFWMAQSLAFPKDSSNWLTGVVLNVGAVLVRRALSVYQFVPLSTSRLSGQPRDDHNWREWLDGHVLAIKEYAA
jgi:hypothetical protein